MKRARCLWLANVDSQDLQDFVSSAVSKIEAGLKEQNYLVGGAIEFDLAVVKQVDKGIGVKIFVVDASIKNKAETITRIKFMAVPSNSKFGRALR
jgi:hypothetical protein